MFATTKTFARPLVLALASLGAVTAAVPAMAAPLVPTPDMAMAVTRVPVVLSDLDLGTVKGRDAAHARVRMAARAACGIGMGKVSLREVQDQQACFTGAVKQGKVQVAMAREQMLASR